MKRNIFILAFIALAITSLFCSADEKESFATFLKRFRTWQTPLDSAVTSGRIYADDAWDNNGIGAQVVKIFICNAQNKDYSDSKFRYGAGAKYQYEGMYVLISGKDYLDPGNSIYDNLLFETLLTVYDKSGKQLSQTTLVQSSDGCYGNFHFANDSTIRVVQAGLIDEESVRIRGPKPIWIDYFKYTIHKDGKVSKTTYKPRAKGEYVFRTAETKVAGIIINGKEVSAKNE